MTRQLAIDIAERAAATFLQAFLAVLLAGTALDFSVPALKAAGLAGIAAVLAMLKGVVASRLGDGTAAFLPPTSGGDGN